MNRIIKITTENIPEYCEMFRDRLTGIVFINNGRIGIKHSCHANIDKTGSIKGMKKLGYWLKDDRCILSHGIIYNIDQLVVSDELDKLCADLCCCVACNERRINKNRSKKPCV